MSGLFKKKYKRGWEPERLPCHIAIIMDGNGRWAAKRALPRSLGHASGAETFRRVATYCKDIGIEYLTVYAFSTENWKRPQEEIDTIMGLLDKYLHEALEKMERDRVRMKFFGDTSVLSPELKALIARTEELSRTFEGVQVNICINYGGRDEILRAASRYAADVLSASGGGTAPGGNAASSNAPGGNAAGSNTANDAAANTPLTNELFSSYMYSAGVPDPDLIIRPSGEYRLSNFLLWQSAYSELYFTDVLWPDFDERELDRAIVSYQSRERRFGGVS